MDVIVAEQEWWGFAVQSWFSLTTLLLSIGAAIFAGFEAKSAKRSAIEADNRATFANQARLEIAEQLKEANRIAKESAALVREQMLLHLQDRERIFEFESWVEWKNGYSSLLIRVRNRSSEHSLTIDNLWIKRFDGDVRRWPVFFSYQEGGAEIPAGKVATIVVSAFSVANAESLTNSMVPLSESASLAMTFQHDSASVSLNLDAWLGFRKLCVSLWLWAQANRHAHRGADLGWDLNGFVYSSPED